MSEIKRLKFPFKSKGFTHELMERKGRVALVARHKNGRSANLEVIVTRERKEGLFKRAGREIMLPAHETYPGDEDWGVYGFSFRACDLDRARQKYEELVIRYPANGQPDHNRQPAH